MLLHFWLRWKLWICLTAFKSVLGTHSSLRLSHFVQQQRSKELLCWFSLPSRQYKVALHCFEYSPKTHRQSEVTWKCVQWSTSDKDNWKQTSQQVFFSQRKGFWAPTAKLLDFLLISESLFCVGQALQRALVLSEIFCHLQELRCDLFYAICLGTEQHGWAPRAELLQPPSFKGIWKRVW